MQDTLLEILRCPKCQGALNLTAYERLEDPKEEISAGLLSCTCNMTYAIWHGVPRMLLEEARRLPPQFVATFRDRLALEAPGIVPLGSNNGEAEEYSFDLEWSMYKYGELTWALDVDTRVEYFYRYLGLSRGDLSGALVLDAGCGNGTLSAAIASSGPEVVALDYASAVERAEQNKKRFAGKGTVHYIQGDVQTPPFAKDTFDAVYSDGVLHHTPNTQVSFNAIAPLLKKGGRLFVWVYRRDLSPGYRLKKTAVEVIQAILRPLSLSIIRKLCFVGAIILLTLLRVQHLLGFKKNRKIIPAWLKTVNLFDTFTPRYNHHHVPEEVKSWFKDNGFPTPDETTIPSLGHMGFGIIGVRGGEAQRVDNCEMNGR